MTRECLVNDFANGKHKLKQWPEKKKLKKTFFPQIKHFIPFEGTAHHGEEITDLTFEVPLTCAAPLFFLSSTDGAISWEEEEE